MEVFFNVLFSWEIVFRLQDVVRTVGLAYSSSFRGLWW